MVIITQEFFPEQGYFLFWKEWKGQIMTSIPKDPVMLLSYLNTQLRDHYNSLKELCSALDLNQAELETKLKAIDYHYDEAGNRFV